MEVQYVFTKDEYELMKRKHDSKVQNLCVMVAENVPVKFWGNKEAKIWGCCVHGTTGKSFGYCDECPSQKDCPEKCKRWSK